MCQKLNQHFKKYNQMYSLGFLLIITLAVIFLFLRVDALETDVDRMINEPNVNHQWTIKHKKVAPDSASIKTEVTVSPEIASNQDLPGSTQPGVTVPGADLPNGDPVPPMPPTDNLPPNQ